MFSSACGSFTFFNLDSSPLAIALGKKWYPLSADSILPPKIPFFEEFLFLAILRDLCLLASPIQPHEPCLWSLCLGYFSDRVLLLLLTLYHDSPNHYLSSNWDHKYKQLCLAHEETFLKWLKFCLATCFFLLSFLELPFWTTLSHCSSKRRKDTPGGTCRMCNSTFVIIHLLMDPSGDSMSWQLRRVL